MREDLELAQYAIENGFAVEGAKREHYKPGDKIPLDPLRFVKEDFRIWKVRGGWRVARQIDEHIRNHDKEPRSLKSALDSVLKRLGNESECFLYKGRAKEVLDKILKERGDEITSVIEWTRKMTVVQVKSGCEAQIRRYVENDSTIIELFDKGGISLNCVRIGQSGECERKELPKVGAIVSIKGNRYRFVRVEDFGRVKMECLSSGMRVSYPSSILNQCEEVE